MSIRMHRPETTRLQLTCDDWLIVKKRLTAGEARDAFARMVTRMQAGERAQLDPRLVGVSRVAAYLVDWSFQDDTGAPLVIKEQPTDLVIDILGAIADDAYAEVLQAVDAHIEQMDREREALKKTPIGAPASSPISDSPA
jgi:hypothetical protein